MEYSGDMYTWKYMGENLTYSAVDGRINGRVGINSGVYIIETLQKKVL